jgi:hypothetical protein
LKKPKIPAFYFLRQHGTIKNTAYDNLFAKNHQRLYSD